MAGSYLDFHGSNVHQVGFANPALITAIKRQLDALSFCTRSYTNRVAIDLAQKLTEMDRALTILDECLTEVEANVSR